MSAADEKNLDRLERQVPLEAEKLVRETYEKAINSGRSVVVSRDGALFRVNRSGSTKIKDIEKSTPVTKTKLSLR